jgi:LSD1 subclass zinc finger protein
VVNDFRGSGPNRLGRLTPEERGLLESMVMISPDLLEVLACPVCRKPLVLRGEDSLKCNECKRVYPIRNGIPILLEAEATIEQL